MNPNPFSWPFRAQFAAGAFACVALLAYAYYEQFAVGLEPCPMCIFQRIAFIAMAIVFLAGALHGPRATGRRVYAVLAFLAAAVGAGVAIRHLWVQFHPIDPMLGGCGPGLSYMLDAFPLTDAIKKAFTGSGDCGEISWRFLGITMPGWTLICYLLLGIGALWAGFRRRLR
jgi:disulfide bond formation protein DsbB